MGALYRKMRPLTFKEVVGQEHVKEPLLRAIREGRLAQAYLFSGPRGVGKTTTARLLAMAVGCEGEEKPCGHCPHCRLVQEGQHPDVLEMDAASHNSVEDVRELRERIHLAPIQAPKRVFILDEAHMLSKSAWNALLKTLEEPPPHVLFIFATTEPERVPPTILSRTQHFRFRRLKEEEISAKLRRILEEMGREGEEEALRLLARLADGAMRDAETLLERFLLLPPPLTRQAVEEALGLPPREALWRILQALSQGQAQEALGEIRSLYLAGFAPRSLAEAFLEVLREALYQGLERGEAPEALLRAMAVLDEGLEGLARRSDALALEALFLRAGLALRPSPSPGASLGEGLKARGMEAEGGPGQGSPKGKPSPSQEPRPEAYRAFLEALRPTLRGILREGRPEVEEGVLFLYFPENREFHFSRALKALGEIQALAQRFLAVKEVRPILGEKGGPSQPPPKAGNPPRPAPQTPSPGNPEEGRLEDPRKLGRLLRGQLLWIRPPREAQKDEDQEEG